MGSITPLLCTLYEGDSSELFQKTYSDLRRMASKYMKGERPDHSLPATALVHEAYLRLVRSKPTRFHSRSHYFCTLAHLMREILVDYARRNNAQKRQGYAERIPLEESTIPSPSFAPIPDILAVHLALERLEREEPELAKIVELHVFGGLTIEETAAVLEMGKTKLYELWSFARAWLKVAIEG
jgi:RNA polymerase sigma factor (TIGR02999 family)